MNERTRTELRQFSKANILINKCLTTNSFIDCNAADSSVELRSKVDGISEWSPVDRHFFLIIHSEVQCKMQLKINLGLNFMKLYQKLYQACESGDSIFSSPEPKAQVSFSDQHLSVVHRCRRPCWRLHKPFTFSSSSPEPL